jgi:hypothetical protein
MNTDEPAGIGQDEFLTVHIGAAAGTGEQLLLVGRPRDGVVRVREWTSDTMNTEGEDYTIDPSELLERIEEAYAARRQISEEIYRIRRWLEGL